VESYAFDLPTASLRAVIGFPGAASFGPALAEGLDFASVAPHQDFAIAFRGGECLLITRLSSAQPVVAALNGVTARPQAIAWSGDGGSAALFSKNGNWIQIVSGLPLNPSAGDRRDLSSLGGSLGAVAVDATGRQIAVAMAGEAAPSNRPRRLHADAIRGSNARSHGAVYLSSQGQAFNSVLPLGNPVALAFAPDSKNLFAVDAAAPELTILNLDSFARQTLALDGLADPFAVRSAFDANGRPMLFVASRSDRLLREYDLTSRQPVATLPLSFVPTGIEEFGHESFLIASRTRAVEPAWLLMTQPQPAVFFIPAVQANSGGAE
jgi:hypothetical protein